MPAARARRCSSAIRRSIAGRSLVSERGITGAPPLAVLGVGVWESGCRMGSWSVRTTVRDEQDRIGPVSWKTGGVASTARLLALLSALQSGGPATGPELAERLGVTVRTVRRDIDRLRELGYAIDARRGAAGSYFLGGGGSAVPPLILDREETVALAVCVRAAAGDSVTGVAEAAGRALGKLRQSLPPAARAQVDALATTTVRLPSAGGEVDHAVLLAVAAACRTPERIEVRYRAASGAVTDRRLEPFRVVNVDRRWYLVAHDLDRRAWRTFRLDRMLAVNATGHGVRLVDPPDPVAYVRASISTAPYPFQVTARIAAPADDVARRVSPSTGVIEPVDDTSCRLTAGADDLDYLAVLLGSLGFDFSVEGEGPVPDGLRARVAELGERLCRAGRG